MKVVSPDTVPFRAKEKFLQATCLFFISSYIAAYYKVQNIKHNKSS